MRDRGKKGERPIGRGYESFFYHLPEGVAGVFPVSAGMDGDGSFHFPEWMVVCLDDQRDADAGEFAQLDLQFL